jgi:TetR/AcrR family transcriptional regulator
LTRLPSDPPPAKRERNAVETRKRLLDAAESEFATKGFAGARLRDVAAVAGVQQALIHHYFTDKEGLYRAVLDRAISETTAGSWEILGRAPDVVTMVESFVDMLVDFYASNANLLAILRMEALSGGALALDLIRERLKPVVDAIEALLRRYQAEGALRADVSVEHIIVAVLAMTFFPFQEAALLEVLWPDRATADEAALRERKRAIVEVALRGVLPGK